MPGFSTASAISPLGKTIHCQSAMRLVQPGYSPHAPYCKVFCASQYTLIFLSLAPATVSQSLSWEELFPAPIPLSVTFPLLPPGMFCSCSTSQLNFWASPLPFPNTTGRNASSTNQHCLTGSSEYLRSAEKDTKIAAIDLKELERNVMLPSPAIHKINQKSPSYFNLTDNIIQPTIYPFSCFNWGKGKQKQIELTQMNLNAQDC